MTRLLSALALAAVVAVPAAQARPAKAAKPQPSAAVLSREAAMKGFDTRMSRLDGLMGIHTRSRSASAE